MSKPVKFTMSRGKRADAAVKAGARRAKRKVSRR